MAQLGIVRLQAFLKDLDGINGLLRLLRGHVLYGPVAKLSGQILTQAARKIANAFEDLTSRSEVPALNAGLAESPLRSMTFARPRRSPAL